MLFIDVVNMKSHMYSVLSGFFASGASLCGKFAMGAEESLWLCEVVSHFLVDSSSPSALNSFPACKNFLLYIRACFCGLMLLFNVVMWTTFVKALRYSTTSLEATVTNTAANFFFTAIFGQVLFGEFLTLMWWIGTLLIIFGLLMMHKGNQQAAILAKKQRKRK